MDNFFQNCPPKMDDGRFLTDFQSSTRRNEYIKDTNNIWRDDQYRLMLQLNGKELMDREWNYDKATSSCWDNRCYFNSPTRVNNKIMAKEMAAYNSMYNLNNYNPGADKCRTYKDFRMF